MKTFAQILNGRLHWKFDAQAAPEFAPGVRISEITGVLPVPQEGWAWDDAGGRFVPPPAPTLADLKTAKNTEINAWRLKANRSTFTHAGKVFACDELSRSDIDGANGMIANLGAMPPGWPGGWKAVDNTVLPIATVADWKAFYGSMFASGNANFIHSQDLKTALAAATTAAQVAAIVW